VPQFVVPLMSTQMDGLPQHFWWAPQSLSKKHDFGVSPPVVSASATVATRGAPQDTTRGPPARSMKAETSRFLMPLGRSSIA
jgi:hypothetical protein